MSCLSSHQSSSTQCNPIHPSQDCVYCWAHTSALNTPSPSPWSLHPASSPLPRWSFHWVAAQREREREERIMEGWQIQYTQHKNKRRLEEYQLTWTPFTLFLHCFTVYSEGNIQLFLECVCYSRFYWVYHLKGAQWGNISPLGVLMSNEPWWTCTMVAAKAEPFWKEYLIVVTFTDIAIMIWFAMLKGMKSVTITTLIRLLASKHGCE